MPIPAPTSTELLNPGFESGVITGWTTAQFGGSGTASVDNVRSYAGSYSAKWHGASGTGHSGGVECLWTNDARGTVAPGQMVSGSVRIALDDTSSSQNQGEARLIWYNAAGAVLDYDSGLLIHGDDSTFRLSSVEAAAPASAAFVAFAVWTTGNSSGGVRFDAATWDYVYNQSAELIAPTNGDSFVPGEVVPLKVTILGDTPEARSVTYKAGATVIGTTAIEPFDFNTDDLAAGTYSITAEVTFADNTYIVTSAHTITIADIVIPPTTREYKASNAYSYLIAKNFAGLSSTVPAIAKIKGVEIVLDYNIIAMIRSKDVDITDPLASTIGVAFDITDGANIEATLMSTSGAGFEVDAPPVVKHVDLERADFTITEQGTSEGKRWSVLDSGPLSVTMGSSTELFGFTDISAPDFIARALGFRFLPVLLAKPSYADSGDACFRFLINKLRVRVYFDAGSADYYFASADKTKVMKGTLVASTITTGDLETGDATGELQLKPTLELIDGTQTWMGDDWTIHAGYPPTDANQIGTVAAREADDGIGMSYNGLPSAGAIVDNRSRYEFITANFFAVNTLDSIYGAHGLPRAFAYNGDIFYKIYTQPEASKDQPRHLAYHHGHLALGFDDGRVDISVIGQPYNYDGALGASEWAIGDKVTGLLPLSGTILGVFGSKSIWGISGTTVDNFATQVIAPNIGAIEYTVTDMGYPVYANAYGVYTLSQTQQYGDYLGSPMSQDISPWLRPRLVRKYTSDKEVVVAWPVRSKNQYRLAFSDGYVMSMTLNAGQQSAPTFSFQKYSLYSLSDTVLGTNTTSVAIPDNDLAGVDSTITVSGHSGVTATLVTVPVSITHTYDGDLSISLSSPDGQTVVVQADDTNNDAVNINQTFSVTFPSPATLDGVWTLNVADHAAIDTGTLNNWSLSTIIIS